MARELRNTKNSPDISMAGLTVEFRRSSKNVLQAFPLALQKPRCNIAVDASHFAMAL